VKILSLVFLILSGIGCKKTGDPGTGPANPPVSEQDPPQYGIPFTNVTDRQDAVIYQVNMRVFSQQGKFAGVMARLDSIKALGVNVVYLMPVYPVGIVNGINSPYSVKDYKAVNAEFGTLSDLRMLVDSVHKKDMSVLLDFVANHTSWDNEWINSHRSWYLQQGGNIVSPNGWNDVAQLDFTNPEMRIALTKAMKFWVLTANVDGFRFDYADGPPVDFWKQAVDTLRNIQTHKLLLLAEGSRNSNYSAGFDFNFGFGFFGNLKNIYNSNASSQIIDNVNISEYNNASNGQQVVRYITNHDVNSSDGTALDLFGGKNGSMAAFVIAAYMKGVPMIYNGQEVGTPHRLTFPFTSTKINWTLNPDITAEYKKVIAFRNNSNAIRRGNLASQSTADVCAFTKEAGAEKVVVIVNLRNSVINYNVPSALANTSWTDALNGGPVSLGNQLELQPYTYIVLKN
jgi:glycosidase